MMHNQPMSKETIKSGNSMMMENILRMPVQPYEDGKGVYRVVETRGRQSRQPRRVPLAVYQHEGKRYLIAPSRGRDWVYNLIAAEKCTLLTSAGQEHARVTPTLDDEAIAAVHAYMAGLADWALQQFSFPATASAEEMRAQAETFAVFRLSF